MYSAYLHGLTLVKILLETEQHRTLVISNKAKNILQGKYKVKSSEKNARIRNQEYLKQFERIQANITASLEKLQELKVVFCTVFCLCFCFLVLFC